MKDTGYICNKELITTLSSNHYMKNPYLYISFAVFAAVGITALFWPPVLYSLFLLVPIFLLGLVDIMQTKHAIRRNFPLGGRLRYVMEDLRPKIYQYFIESDTDGKPFNRISRSVVYQRAKKEVETTPFGTQLEVYDDNYEWLSHSINALDIHGQTEFPRVRFGGPDCKQPYDASIYNISAMSYGSLSTNAILALSGGAKIGGFAHNTGEGGISDYHLQGGGDLIWQIGTGYFGCRTKDGNFDPQAFAEKSVHPHVKMIEVKLSQGAKPGHGGLLPASKVNDEIARVRMVEKGKDVASPPCHKAFSTPIGLMHFIAQLRELSEGKPVGFKLSIGHRSEFVAICKAMIVTGIYPDFITVDGGEGGTGAAPPEFSNSVGMPLRDALAFVYDTLTGFDLKKYVKIIASGKVVTGFDIVKNFALGADACNTARGMMLALGCIQALECNTNKCPTGVATQDPGLVRGLVVDDKKIRVANFHRQTVKSAFELMAAAGIKDPSKLHRVHIQRRVSPKEVQSYLDTYPYIGVGSLLNGPYPKAYELLMSVSDANSFSPQLDNIDYATYTWVKKPMTS